MGCRGKSQEVDENEGAGSVKKLDWCFLNWVLIRIAWKSASDANSVGQARSPQVMQLLLPWRPRFFTARISRDG